MSDSEVDLAVEKVLSSIDDSDPDSEDDELASDGQLSAKSQRDLAVANVVPLTSVVTMLHTKRGRGRPPKVRTMPTVDDLAYHAQMQRQEAQFVDCDEIVQVTIGRKNSAEVLHQIKERLARQAANLEFRRIELNKTGRDSSQIISRQAAILRELAGIELKIRELGSHALDIRGENFQKVFKLFLEKISTVASSVLPPEQYDIFFNKLENELQGWEDAAEAALR